MLTLCLFKRMKERRESAKLSLEGNRQTATASVSLKLCINAVNKYLRLSKMICAEGHMVESFTKLHTINSERTTARRHHEYIAFSRSEIIGQSEFFFRQPS